jgi:hypothetical protein
MRRLVPVVLALTIAVSASTAAQETPTAEKWTNVEWYDIGTWYFSDGEEALALWTEHFLPVVNEIWPESTCLWFMTGETHMTCYGPMSEGPAEMEWRMHPDGVRFMEAFTAQEGEAAEELFERWGNAVSKYTSHIALKHTGGM